MHECVFGRPHLHHTEDYSHSVNSTNFKVHTFFHHSVCVCNCLTRIEITSHNVDTLQIHCSDCKGWLCITVYMFSFCVMCAVVCHTMQLLLYFTDCWFKGVHFLFYKTNVEVPKTCIVLFGQQGASKKCQKTKNDSLSIQTGTQNSYFYKRTEHFLLDIAKYTLMSIVSNWVYFRVTNDETVQEPVGVGLPVSGWALAHTLHSYSNHCSPLTPPTHPNHQISKQARNSRWRWILESSSVERDLFLHTLLLLSPHGSICLGLHPEGFLFTNW